MPLHKVSQCRVHHAGILRLMSNKISKIKRKFVEKTTVACIHLLNVSKHRWSIINKISVTVLRWLTAKCGWVRMSPLPSLTFFPCAFWLIFLFCRKSASYSRKIIEYPNFAVQTEIFPKNTVFTIPPHTLGCVAQTTHAQKIRSR